MYRVPCAVSSKSCDTPLFFLQKQKARKLYESFPYFPFLLVDIVAHLRRASDPDKLLSVVLNDVHLLLVVLDELFVLRLRVALLLDVFDRLGRAAEVGTFV